MKKSIKNIIISLVLIILMTNIFSVTSFAANDTKQFLEPFEDATFSKAYSVNITLPQNYDASPTKDKIFSPNSDKKALASFMTKKTMDLFKSVYGDNYTRKYNLMKDYVAVDIEIIYEFKNGFKDFDFLGIAGAGNWAGAFGKTDAIEFYYADTADGKWTKFDYDKIRKMPSGAESTYCHFTSSSIPKTARFLKMRSKNGATWDDNTQFWEPEYQNWEFALGYLLVNEYTKAQGTTDTTTSKPTSGKDDNKTNNNQSTVSGTTSSGATSNIQDENNVENEDTTTVQDGDVTIEKSFGEPVVKKTVDTVRLVDKKLVAIIIIVDAVVMLAVIAVLIILYRKKIQKL